MSFVDEGIVEAVSRGWNVTDEGVIRDFNNEPVEIKQRVRGSGCFYYRLQKRKIPLMIPISKFGAYYFYGEKLFDEDTIVRGDNIKADVIPKEKIKFISKSEARNINLGYEKIPGYTIDESRKEEALECFQKSLSSSNRNVLNAYLLGYRILKDGRYVSPDGYVMPVKNHKSRNNPNRYTYPLGVASKGGLSYRYKIHRLAAFCFHGSEMFEEGIEVRHLDADVENVKISNIKLGTHKENVLDVPDERRRTMHLKRSYESYDSLRDLDEKQVLHVVNSLKNTKKTYKEIGEDVGTPGYTVGRINKGQVYLNTMELLGFKNIDFPIRPIRKAPKTKELTV